MAPNRLVLFGGITAGGILAHDTWEWASGDWQQITTVAQPSGRYTQAFWDTVLGETILFAGNDGSYLADTWAWTSHAWTNITPVTSPDPRESTQFCWDDTRSVGFMYGGFNGSHVPPYLEDQWRWSSGVWTLVDATADPGKRTSAAVAFDSLNEKIVVFAGSSGLGFLADTWTWNGTAWTSEAPAASPSFRNSTMAWDPVSQRVILFGGTGASLFADTWAWTGTNWVQLFPASSPSARRDHGMAVDPITEQIILFGGFDGTVLSDTWTWTGSDWSQLTPSTQPSGRYLSAFAPAFWLEQTIALRHTFGL